jgi:hypothetical protein
MQLAVEKEIDVPKKNRGAKDKTTFCSFIKNLSMMCYWIINNYVTRGTVSPFDKRSTQIIALTK